ncbi:MAG: hypothetical protein AAGF97_12005 [Planctomycetota bacterium]
MTESNEEQQEKQEFVADLLTKLKQERDEIKLQIHLGKAELRDEWDKMEEKFVGLNNDYEPLREAVGETADEVWESLKLVGGELLEGFHRIRKSL